MRESGNINFVLIGAKATGKTVYLASLFLNLKNITSQNEHTIEYLKPLANNLANKEYPQATAGNLHELMFDYKDEKFVSHIQIDDVDGYFIESMHKSDESTKLQRDTLLRNIKHSEGIIFFFPYQDKFNEESIKNFNYEIDTFISKLREMYHDRKTIPIPSVIAVSKWDTCSHYKAEDEADKAIEYINNNKILKFAKEKIELNFSNTKVIPISSIGKNFDLETHNIEKPINFFLEETYKIWEKKIEKLSSNRDELIKFLSKIYFDMKFYKDGQYTKQYDKIEEEYVAEFLSKVDKVDNYTEFTKIHTSYSTVISAFKPDSQKKIEEIENRLKSKQNKKSLRIKAGIIIPIIIILFGASNWYLNAKTKKSQDELFSDICIEFKNKNYKDTTRDIIKYESEFKGDINTKHKDKIESIKREINDIYGEKFTKLKDSISNLSYEDAVTKTESNWSNIFLDGKIVIMNILKKKYNDEISNILNSMPSSINDIDDLIDLENKSNKLMNIKRKVLFVDKTEELELSAENNSFISEKKSLYDRYVKVLDDGVQVSKITFGSNSEDNEPLGFECTSEYQIILTVEGTKYHFKDKLSCINNKISWNSYQTFKMKNKYNVLVIEEDLIENDEYEFWFKLVANDLIKIANGEYFKIDIVGGTYYIGFGKR